MNPVADWRRVRHRAQYGLRLQKHDRRCETDWPRARRPLRAGRLGAAGRQPLARQSIDAGSGSHLWAERFDKPVADLFEMQDEVVGRIANQLNTELIAAEARRADRATDPDSMDLFFRAQALMNLGERNFPQALELYQRAIDIDPTNVEALAGWSYATAVAAGPNFASANRMTDLAAAERAALRAIDLAPNHARAYMALGMACLGSYRIGPSLAHFERARALDHNFVHTLAGVGAVMVYTGDAEKAEKLMKEAFRLSPRDTNGNVWCVVAGMANMALGRDEQVVAWVRCGIGINRKHFQLPLLLTAALALEGKIAEAREAAKMIFEFDPDITVRLLRQTELTNDPTFLLRWERFYQGLLLAGVPEG
jgi:tetratricopeptide (TPR) repeat protein